MTDVPGFRDSRGALEMWRAASPTERAIVLGAPLLLVIAINVLGRLA